MVTTLTAVKVTIPTIKIMMSMSSPQILTKKMSLIQMTKTRLLQQQPQEDGMNVWYLHTAKIEPKTDCVSDRNSWNLVSPVKFTVCCSK